MKNIFYVIVFSFFCSSAFSITGRTISLYVVKPAESPPVIDGYTDEGIWKTADVATDSYRYWHPDPPPGELNTEWRMLYDERGLYLSIKNYDEHIDKIRATKTTRDDPALWTDDCVELYIDPMDKAVGYIKFVINSLGTKHDYKKLDSAVTLWDWRADGWLVKTSKGKDYWMLEAFFPWSDLEKKASAEDFWRFDVVRYSYSTGKFRGTTWSPGGNYNAPQNFGYLFFAGSERVDYSRIEKYLADGVTPPWILVKEDGFLTCQKAGKLEFSSREEVIKNSKKEADYWLTLTDKSFKEAGKESFPEGLLKNFETVREEFKSLPADLPSAIEAQQRAKKIGDIKNTLQKIYWELQIYRSLEEI